MTIVYYVLETSLIYRPNSYFNSRTKLLYRHDSWVSQKREMPFIAENVSIWTHTSSELFVAWPVKRYQVLVDVIHVCKAIVKANNKIKSILDIICKCMRDRKGRGTKSVSRFFECKTWWENNSEFNFLQLVTN